MFFSLLIKLNPRYCSGRVPPEVRKSFQSPQYKKFSAFEYVLYFQHFTIKKYLEKIRRIQSLENENFFPNEESYVRSYFNNTSQNFNINKIRYRNNTNLDIISSILANIVKSGSVFIKSTESLDYINKPVLLFYGIEHLSSFFLNMHYNFTQENTSLSPIMSSKYYKQRLLTLEDYNIGFYLKYIIDRINELYIRKIFTIIDFYNDKITTHLKNLDRNTD